MNSIESHYSMKTEFNKVDKHVHFLLSLGKAFPTEGDKF